MQHQATGSDVSSTDSWNMARKALSLSLSLSLCVCVCVCACARAGVSLVENGLQNHYI